MITHVTVTEPIGVDTDKGRRQLPAGTYPVEDVDAGEYVGVVGPGGVFVWLEPSDVGLAACPPCNGRGSWSFPEVDGNYEVIDCEDCGSTGFVTPDKAVELRRRDELAEGLEGPYWWPC